MEGQKITTIQVNWGTLMFLKQLKQELGASSYDEAIMKLKAKSCKRKSMAGSLGKYFKDYSTEKMVKELQKERREGDRF